MPIKPENKGRYPANWKDIRAAILERAGNCCEWAACGVANRSVGIWKAGVFFKLADSRHTADLAVDAATEDGDKVTEIVLTIAHLDHTPEHCDPSNLMAMCQRHHLAYDQAHHTTSAYMTRKARMQTLELPL
jgi:streptomycin 6-kinase